MRRRLIGFRRFLTTYYLLGFSHYENYTFEMPLLRKLHPRAKVYVINIDSFFDQIRDATWQNRDVGRVGESSLWNRSAIGKRIHKAICRAFKRYLWT